MECPEYFGTASDSDIIRPEPTCNHLKLAMSNARPLHVAAAFSDLLLAMKG